MARLVCRQGVEHESRPTVIKVWFGVVEWLSVYRWKIDSQGQTDGQKA